MNTCFTWKEIKIIMTWICIFIALREREIKEIRRLQIKWNYHIGTPKMHTPSALECKALESLNLYPNVRHRKVLWTKRHANLLSFGTNFVKKENQLSWAGE